MKKNSSGVDRSTQVSRFWWVNWESSRQCLVERRRPVRWGGLFLFMADSQNLPQRGTTRCSDILVVLFRFWFTFVFALIIAFLFAFVCGFIAVLVETFSISKPLPVAAHCKILSSSVDLRSSKVCELGFLNYKAKNLLERRSRFRCRYDYYWASVFQVEFKQYSSGQTLHAFAEAPKEVLPLDCRPSFGTAWMTKEKFKVNETYNCRYTPGISKVDIYTDDFFNCKAREPSVIELLRRIFVLCTRSMNYLFFKNETSKHIFWDVVVGIFATPLFSIFIALVKILGWKLGLVRKHCAKKYCVAIRRVCLLMVSFVAMGWLSIRYARMLGLSDLFSSARLGNKLIKV